MAGVTVGGEVVGTVHGGQLAGPADPDAQQQLLPLVHDTAQSHPTDPQVLLYALGQLSDGEGAVLLGRLAEQHLPQLTLLQQLDRDAEVGLLVLLTGTLPFVTLLAFGLPLLLLVQLETGAVFGVLVLAEPVGAVVESRPEGVQGLPGGVGQLGGVVPVLGTEEGVVAVQLVRPQSVIVETVGLDVAAFGTTLVGETDGAGQLDHL